MELELVDPRERSGRGVWCDLEASSQPSYFLSAGWVDNWLAALPAEEIPELAIVRDDAGQPQAAFFLGKRNLLRHGVFASRALYINATGSERHDEVCIEHNGVVGRCSFQRLVELLPDGWDELFVPAVDRTTFDDIGALRGYRVRVDHESIAPFVDLDAVRSVEGGYISLLGASMRNQLRRTRRLVGNLDVEIAGDPAHALDIYGELLRLHARSWESRGRRGAFADPWFERFHRQLILDRLASGEIQLMRVRAGALTIGCLYNFVYRGRVLFYQSGLAGFDHPHIKPGYLCHAAAVEYNALAGHQIYDLLAGTTRYKRSLATGETRLVWLRVQRPRLRFAIEERLRSVKRAVVAHRLTTAA